MGEEQTSPYRTGFKLQDMFDQTDGGKKSQNNSDTNICLENLCSFKNHPFKIYTGERFTDMIDSIRDNGVLLPIIVRPIDNYTYEILSGHNRVEAARAAGLDTIPAIIRENLTDEDALLTDLSHSERAVTLAMHHEAIKKQGKRTDLIREIESIMNDTFLSNNESSEISVLIGRKLNSREKTALEYGLNNTTVARYLRVNKLLMRTKNGLITANFHYMQQYRCHIYQSTNNRC